MPINLNRGAYAGRETFLLYNDPDASPTPGTYEAPVWVDIGRERNVTVNDGPSLSDVEFHGAGNISQVPGYKRFAGSFELVRKRGTETIYDALKAAADAGDILDMVFLNGASDVDGSKGWRAPIVLGEFAETNNGNDVVAATVPFGLADAYDDSDNAIGRVAALVAGGVITFP